MRAAPLLILLSLGCVPLPPELAGTGPSGSITRTAFGGLDPGAKSQTSLHFEVRAYRGEREAADLAERLYARIMNDTGLLSFMPRGLYPIVIYGSQEEYVRKTGMPSWSGGVSVGNSIHTFEGPQLPGVLAHEMTHLIFHEYMGRSLSEHRWVNEGLAVYEEQEAAREARAGGHTVVPDWSTSGGLRPLPFDQMVGLAPLSEESRAASLWYMQVGSVVRFMIERGGRVGFSQFLRGLRDGRGLDDAVRAGFPGVFDGLRGLEGAWQRG